MSTNWRSCCGTHSITCSGRMARRSGSGCPPGSWSSRTHARPGGGDRRRALGGAPAAGARIALAYQGPVAPEARPRSPNCARRSRAPGCWRSPARTGCMPAGLRRRARGGQVIDRLSHIERSWRRWRRAPRWSPSWTAIRRRMPGWARCEGSAWSRSVRTGLGRAGTSRISIGSTAWIRSDPGRLRAGAALGGATVTGIERPRPQRAPLRRISSKVAPVCPPRSAPSQTAPTVRRRPPWRRCSGASAPTAT